MNNILDEIEKEERFTDGELLIGIFTRPRAVFKYLHQNNYDKYVIVFLALSGIIGSLDVTEFYYKGFVLALISIFVLGALSGVISNYLLSFVLSWFGKRLGGEQEAKSIVRVVAYTMIPSFLSVIFFLIQLIYYSPESGSGGFAAIGSGYESSLGTNFMYVMTSVSILISVIWPMVLIVIGVSEVQNFSIGRAFVNVFLPIFILILFGVFAFVLTDMFL